MNSNKKKGVLDFASKVLSTVFHNKSSLFRVLEARVYWGQNHCSLPSACMPFTLLTFKKPKWSHKSHKIMSSLTSDRKQLQNNSISKMFGSALFRLLLICPVLLFLWGKVSIRALAQDRHIIRCFYIYSSKRSRLLSIQ